MTDMKKILLGVVVITVWAGLHATIPAAAEILNSEITAATAVPPDRQHESSLALSAEAVAHKIRNRENVTLVDVRSPEAFSKLNIPGSLNIRLHAVKTKTFLKSTAVVLVNEGYQYSRLVDECRRLENRGFSVFILDGGINAWNCKGGPLAGSLLELKTVKEISPREFHREKGYAGGLAFDVSATRTAESRQLMPSAQHFPDLAGLSGAIRKFIRTMGAVENTPFQTVVIFNQSGEHYERIETRMTQTGLAVFYLKGGVDAYKKFIEQLILSRQPRDKRIKTSVECRPCGSERQEEVVQ